MIKENDMTTRNSASIAWCSLLATLVALVSWALGMPCRAQTESKATAPATFAAQKGFASPKEAANALVQAAEQFDVPSLKEILGSDGEALVTSKDTVQDKNRAAAFAAEAKTNLTVNLDSKNPNHATVVVGNEDWPLPIPLVKRGTEWYFDSKAGKQEILDRRIGENELNAITICRGFDEAQHEYASEIHDNSGVNQYAQKIISTPGKHDGLAWQNPDGTWGGSVGEGVAKAIAEGYSNRTQPLHGYYFKILKGQGPAARLGQLDYVINGVMIGGFGLVAWPAEYRVTGVQTFIVSYDGVVYQKDLGPDTTKIAEAIERYDAVLRLTGNPRLLATALTDRGYAFYSQKEYAEAQKSFGAALHEFPEESAAMIGMGLVTERSGKPEGAATFFTRAVELQPSDQGYLLLAQALDSAGKKDAAQAARERAGQISRNLNQAEESVRKLLAD